MDNRIANFLIPDRGSGEVEWIPDEEPKLPVTFE